VSSPQEPLHDDEIAVDLGLVRALVTRDLPGAAQLPLVRLGASGSSNALFRLGDALVVRLPRQPGGGDTVVKEARWLPYVGAGLPASVPTAEHVGEPGFGYHERWSVVRWLDGRHPEPVPPDAEADPSLVDVARDLAAVVTALRSVPVTDEARRDPALRWYRGEPLATRDADTRQSVEACRAIPALGIDLDAALAVWDAAMRLPGAGVAEGPRWYHGDLAAENLLVREGRLAAVLDFGGLAVGDPTVDLMVAWEVLDTPARAVFRAALGVDDSTWELGRAWALSLALMTFPYYWATMPARCASRHVITRNVLADAGFA
jgi:aminoglycoside phosphotransferase (APT) family kinase protein